MAIVTYVVDPIYHYLDRILPTTNLSGHESNEISLSTCPGEFVPATFVIKPDTTLSSVTFEVTGFPWSPDAIDLRVVKCWMTRGHLMNCNPNPDITEYIPDLLLKDDSLVIVENNENKIRFLDGQYHQVSHSSYTSSSNLDIMDSSTLLPFGITANTNKQIWVTIHPPAAAPNGTYDGIIIIKENGVQIGSMSLSVNVLPFTLPESPITPGIYCNQVTSSTNMPNGTTSTAYRSQTQLYNEFINLYNHGIRVPSIHQSYHNLGEANFSTYMYLRSQANFDNAGILWVEASGDNIAAGLTPAQVTQRVQDYKNYMALHWGTAAENIYFYGQDETAMNTQAVYEQALAVQAQNCKIMNALGDEQTLASFTYGGNTIYVYQFLDLCNLAYNPIHGQNTMTITNLHNNSNLVSSYNNPQTGEEQPLKYRMHFGLLLWKYGYDAMMDYTYIGGAGCLWDDWQYNESSGNMNHFKQHCFAYPTLNSTNGDGGVIDTTGFEGLREGINDLRYLQKLIDTIADADSRGINHDDATAYIAWLQTQTFQYSETTYPPTNMEEIRQNIIQLTLDLLDAMTTPSGPDDSVTFTIHVGPYGGIIQGSVSYPPVINSGESAQITFEITNLGADGEIWHGLFDLNTNQYLSGPTTEYFIRNQTAQRTITVPLTTNFHGELRGGHLSS